MEFGPLALQLSLLETSFKNRKINSDVIPFSKQLIDTYQKNETKYPLPFFKKKRNSLPEGNEVFGKDIHNTLIEELERRNVPFTTGSIPSRTVETLPDSSSVKSSSASSTSIKNLLIMAKTAKSMEEK
jgi:hypothetical protein